MTFPTVDGSATYAQATAQTGHDLTISNASSGKTILAFFAIDADTTISWPAGWTELEDTANTSGGGPVTHAAAYKKSDGTETTVTATSGVSADAVGATYTIGGAADPDVTPPESAVWSSSGNVGTHECPTVTVSTAKDYLLVAGYGQDTSAGNVTFPTSDNQLEAESQANNNSFCQGAWFTVDINGTSLDPGDITINGTRPSVAISAAVHPSGGGGGGISIPVVMNHLRNQGIA